MDDEAKLRKKIDQAVRWSSHHFEKEAEINRLYAGELEALPSLPEETPAREWEALQLGRTTVRFLRESLADVTWALLGDAPAPAFLTRSAAEEEASVEYVLQAEG